MAAFNTLRAFAVIIALAGATAAYAQEPAPVAPPPGSEPEPKLMFDREVYAYPGTGRRDPFKPLLGKESMGPLFEDLKLKGIIYSSEPTRSLVLLQDGSRRIYRLHRGDVVGNARVVEIRPLAVRMAVENLGMVRYEMMQLRPADASQPRLAQAQPTMRRYEEGYIDVTGQDSATVTQLLDSLAAAKRANVAKKQNTNPSPLPEAR